MYRPGGARDPQQKTKRDLLVYKSWAYLHDNFHKFAQRNKIKIALELAKKDIPLQLDGNLHIDVTNNLRAARQRVLDAISGN